MRFVKKFFKTIAVTLGSLMLLSAAVDIVKNVSDSRRNLREQS